MNNDLIGQILGSVLGGHGAQQDASGGGLGALLGGLGGGLGGLAGMMGASQAGGLGGLFGGATNGANVSQENGAGGVGGVGGMLGGKGPALAALLIPLAMQWVQRNGGLGSVLDRFKQHGYSQQASSWVSAGQNDEPPRQAVKDVMGEQELSQMSQQLGVSQDEVSGAMAQVLPQLVDHLTPQGHVPDDSNDRLNRGLSAFGQLFQSTR